MSTNLGFPAILVHPGDILKEEFEYRKLSQKKFAQAVGISYTMFNEILNAKRPISTDIAMTLEATLGINAEMLVTMQTRYNLQVAYQDKNRPKRWEELRKIGATLQ